MALGDIYLRFTWQAWHKLTSTVVLRGRRGTFCVAGVALMVLGGALGPALSPIQHPPSFHVAGVALGDIHLRFAWQAWHFGHWAGSGFALGLDWLPVTLRHLRGRRGTWQHSPWFNVAGVALGDIHLRFARQAWCLETCTFVLSHTIFHTPSLTHHL